MSIIPRNKSNKPALGSTYEEIINAILKKNHFQNSNSKSGGSSSRPDGYFILDGKENPLEIKRDLSADFAQIELRWSPEQKFMISTQTQNPEFREFLLNQKDFLSEINRTWIVDPRKFTKSTLNKEDHNWDQDHFRDIKQEVDVSFIEQFYNSKKIPTYYIQIGTRGFYYLGKDVLNLKVPRLNGRAIIRARVKTRHSNPPLYGFLIAIKLRGTKSSSHDIEENKGRHFPFS